MTNDPSSIGASRLTTPSSPHQYETAPDNKGKGSPYATISVILAVLGVIPLIIFLFYSLRGLSEAGIAFLFFMLIGVMIHGIGVALGIIGYIMKARISGFIGIISNSGILFFTLLGGVVGASH